MEALKAKAKARPVELPNHHSAQVPHHLVLRHWPKSWAARPLAPEPLTVSAPRHERNHALRHTRTAKVVKTLPGTIRPAFFHDRPAVAPATPPNAPAQALLRYQRPQWWTWR
jgi:hypothetical protein